LNEPDSKSDFVLKEIISTRVLPTTAEIALVTSLKERSIDCAWLWISEKSSLDQHSLAIFHT